MKYLVMAIAFVVMMAGCAHTLTQVDKTATEAVKLPVAVYEDVRQNVNTVIQYLKQQDSKSTE